MSMMSSLSLRFRYCVPYFWKYFKPQSIQVALLRAKTALVGVKKKQQKNYRSNLFRKTYFVASSHL